MLHLRLNTVGLHELVTLVDFVLLAFRQLFFLSLRRYQNYHLVLLLLSNCLQRLCVICTFENRVEALLHLATLGIIPSNQNNIHQRPVGFFLVAENHILDDCARHSQQLGNEIVDVASPITDCRLLDEVSTIQLPVFPGHPQRSPFDRAF